MKAVIDIGSNSVRLLLGGKKTIHTTTLAKGLSSEGRLSTLAIKDTARAVVELYDYACDNDAKEIFVFATEAVRAASNSSDFLTMLQSFNINVEVLSAEQEAISGFLGAYTGGIQAVLDIGGASSELSIGDGDGLAYCHSLGVGAQRLADKFCGNIRQLSFYIKERIKEYGIVPSCDSLIAIGGTATTLVAIKESLEPYRPEVVQGYILSASDIYKCAKEIFALPLAARYNIKGLQPKRADIIAPGALLLYHIMEYLNFDNCTVSEKDNMEGFLQLKLKDQNRTS